MLQFIRESFTSFIPENILFNEDEGIQDFVAYCMFQQELDKVNLQFYRKFQCILMFGKIVENMF